MSITACNFVSETASDSKDGPSNTQVWHIEANAWALPAAIRDEGFTGKPAFNSTHAADTSKVTSRSCEYVIGTESPWVYTYTVTYASNQQEKDEKQDPDEEAPQIEWGGNDTTEEVYLDRSTTPKRIENSAHQTFETQPTRESGDGCVTISRNELTNNAALWNSYSHSLNDSSWFGNSQFTCKLGRITASKQRKNGVDYWRVAYPISFKEHTFLFQPIDAGTCTKVSTADGVRQDAILDINGVPITSAVLLDGNGNQLDLSASPIVLGPFKLYKELDWSTLDLPNPFA